MAGEQSMVCMSGFLYLEMYAEEAGRKLMGGSGWERRFHLPKIFTPGVAASILGCKQVKRTRLTLAWLEILKRNTYEKYCRQPGPQESLAMLEQLPNAISKSPTVLLG